MKPVFLIHFPIIVNICNAGCFWCLKALLRKHGFENQNREHSYTIKLGNFMALDSMVQFKNFHLSLFFYFIFN